MEIMSNFNPRSREGSDDNSPTGIQLYSNFNPRSREGSDPSRRRPEQPIRLFQSSLPRGERHALDTVNATSQADFNPRSREGSDVDDGGAGFIHYISILAPARGATGDAVIYVNNNLFQSSLPRGEQRFLFAD